MEVNSEPETGNIGIVSQPSQEQAPLTSAGGWLWIFGAGLMLSSVLTTRSILWGEIDGVPFIFQGLDIILAIFQIYVAMSIFRLRPNAIKYVRILFVVFALILASSLIAALFLYYQASEEFGSVQQYLVYKSGALLGESIRPIVWLLIWFPYFRRSKRVLNTFGRNL